MAEAAIPVDLFNPGQVFACLGFLEAANILLGDAEGGFDWSNENDVCFRLHADGDVRPCCAVLEFLVRAQVKRLAPVGYADQPSKGKKGKTKRKKRSAEGKNDEAASNDGPICIVESFPRREADEKTLPIRLEQDERHIDLTHWCDASSRNDFKLFAGQQRGAAIARSMLGGIAELGKQNWDKLIKDPFGLTVPMAGSSFKFDPRKSWTAIGAGYSPDEQKHLVAASPVIELMAALGLEHARPDEDDELAVRYGVWGSLLPPALARPALAGVSVGVPMRVFRFTLDKAGENKVVTFAQEQTS